MSVKYQDKLAGAHRQTGVGMIELQVAILIFIVCIVSLTKMQLKAGMEGLDNYQRSTALMSSQALMDRISANNSGTALSEYINRVQEISNCGSYTPKQCQATSSNAAEACTVTDMAAFDVWDVFCSDEQGLDSRLVDYTAELTCDGTCTPNPDMTLRVSWVSRYADTDERLNETTEYGNTEVASNLDFISLQFRP